MPPAESLSGSAGESGQVAARAVACRIRALFRGPVSKMLVAFSALVYPIGTSVENVKNLAARAGPRPPGPAAKAPEIYPRPSNHWPSPSSRSLSVTLYGGPLNGVHVHALKQWLHIFSRPINLVHRLSDVTSKRNPFIKLFGVALSKCFKCALEDPTNARCA